MKTIRTALIAGALMMSGSVWAQTPAQPADSVAVKPAATTEKSTYAPILYGNVNIVVRGGERASIYVDGKERGFGSWSGELTAGEHLIETRAKNAANSEKRIMVAPNQTMNVEIDPPTAYYGTFLFDVKPRDLTITYNGKKYDHNSVINVPYGEHVLEFSHKGYYSQTVNQLVRSKTDYTIHVDLKRIYYVKPTTFYIGASYDAGALQSVSVLGGATYKNIDLQLGYTIGLTASSPVYFYNNATADNNTLTDIISYKVSSFSVKAGYQFAVLPRIGIVPQVGFRVQRLSGTNSYGSSDFGNGAGCGALTIGAKALLVPFHHMVLFVAPEMGVGVGVNDSYRRIADASNVTAGGFSCAFGVMANF